MHTIFTFMVVAKKAESEFNTKKKYIATIFKKVEIINPPHTHTHF